MDAAKRIKCTTGMTIDNNNILEKFLFVIVAPAGDIAGVETGGGGG